MSGKCNAMSLACYVVSKCENDGVPISNLQLQKIMYFLQSVYCRSTDGNLLFDDCFEAWPYGPVLPRVYKRFSKYGGRLIHETFDAWECSPLWAKKFVDEGIEVLRRKSPWDLVRTSHAPGSPWAQVWKEGAGFKQRIPNELIIQAATKGSLQ